MSNDYDVILVSVPGEASADNTVAKSRLQEVFGIDEAGAARLIEQLPTTVKRKTSLEEARTYYEAFRAMGAPGPGRPRPRRWPPD